MLIQVQTMSFYLQIKMFKMTHVSSDLSPTRFLYFKRYHYSLILIYHAVLTFGVIEKAGL